MSGGSGGAIEEAASALRGTAACSTSTRLAPPKETPVDRAIREQGERLRKTFPWLDERRRK
jgi:hypothetical protein